MGGTDLVVLDTIIGQWRQQTSQSPDVGTAFRQFVVEQVLKDFDLSYEQLDSGNVESGNDGGFYGLFIFVNGFLVSRDTVFAALKGTGAIDVYVLQAKHSSSFSEFAID